MTDVNRCSCGRPAGMGHSLHCDYGYEGEARRLLIEWEKYARTIAEAGIVALPSRLVNATVGLLDATSV